MYGYCRHIFIIYFSIIDVGEMRVHVDLVETETATETCNILKQNMMSITDFVDTYKLYKCILVTYIRN